MGAYFGPWLWILGFAIAQLLSWAMTGDSLFGHFTGGVVESLHLRTGLPMKWHVASGSAMWGLGFVQIYCKRLRHGSLAWLHRASGRLCLLLWCFVVGPTAAYLSLNVGEGRARAHFFMALFALMGMDTTLFAYYYFMRALLIARRRDLGEERLDLHGRAMRTGMLFTMLILFQRPLQFLMIVLRKAFLVIVSMLPHCPLPDSWELVQGLVAAVSVVLGSVGSIVLDHHVILSATTALPMAALLFVLDGPRSRLGHWLLPLRHGEETAMFGSLEPGRLELLFWRLRVPAYVLLRMAVTRGWTQDPVPEPPLES